MLWTAWIAGGLPLLASPWNIIPKPELEEPSTGTFELRAETPWFADSVDARGVASLAVRMLEPAIGSRMPVRSGKPRAEDPPSVVLSTKGADASLGEEGYELIVEPKAVSIRAPRPAGLFYGVQTLRQMLPPEAFGAEPVRGGFLIRCGRVVDRPRFRWRGYLLDVGRHFRSVEYVKRTIDRLASLKMNVLHWHLTEDQGWRIEIRRYPRLTEIGAWRDQDGRRYGGFYTQREVREVVRYARERHVTVVPEIEMPGHCVAALAAYPELSCTGGPFQVANRWGVFADVYCVGQDGTLDFLKGVLDEVLELFPSRFIHIGGDEVPKDRWRSCSRCQERIRREGLRDEHELQSWFVRQIDAYLTSKGRRLVGWDEILEGGLAEGATVQSWRGMGGAIQAAKAGHDVIASPTSHCYLDYPLSAISLEKAYSFEPVPPELTEQESKHILGLEGNMWGERTPEEWDVDRQTYPRLMALAEVAWSPREARDWADFQRRLSVHRKRLHLQGVAFALDSTAKVGVWTPETVAETAREAVWPLDASLLRPGARWVVEFQYEAGLHGLEVQRVSLEVGGQVVAEDAHTGFAGGQNRANRYLLRLPRRLPPGSALLRATIRSDGGTDSRGSVWLLPTRLSGQR
ncbi:MAG: beta-N-acetylhexosaminidase [Fimbriimonadales bacterium]